MGTSPSAVILCRRMGGRDPTPTLHTLRNVALTFPYLHDGSTSYLAEVVEIMVKYQVGSSINEKDTQAIVALLEKCTGEYNGVLIN